MRLFAVAFVAGTFSLQQRAELPDSSFWLAGVAALLAVALVRRRPCVHGAMWVLAGALLGFGHAAWRAEIRLAESLPRALEGRDLEVTGVVAGLPRFHDKGARFLFDIETASGERVPERVSLSWFAERGKGSEGAQAPPRLAAGDRWTFTVRLKRPRGLANPHGFDFEAWALERGIRATGYVRGRQAHVKAAERVEGWPCMLHRWRGEIRDRMLQRLADARLRGVLVALAIGDQDAIGADDWRVFWRTGVGHLMSISGLHITMLAALAFAIAFAAWVRIPALALRYPARKAAIFAATAVALAYTLMTGYAVPAQRTFVMLAVIAGCVLCDRHGSASRVLALAALAVLVLDPWAVLSAGFWLSFGAVAAIFYVMALRTGVKGRLARAAAEQLAVTAVMLPMLLALFQEVSLVSPLANAVAIPLVSLAVVPLAIAGAFLDAAPLLDGAHALMLALMSPLERLAELPGAMVESHAPLAWTVAAGVVGCAWLLAPRGFPLRALGVLWMVPMFAFSPPLPLMGAAWLDVLDVGHGLAVVVRTARHALAYDTGPSWNAEADSGSRIVVPFLRGEGVARLDALVISHADDDHAGGAASVVESREPRWLLSSLPSSDPLHESVDRTSPCEAGQAWSWDGVEFRVLHPAKSIHAEAGKRKENDRSCVLKVSTPAAAALLTGDVEARSEAEMLARDPSALRAGILLAPHHGSKTSSTAPFIDAVSPAVALLSVGYRNRFRHPHEGVVARYAERGIVLRRTDAEGALHVRMPAESGGAVTVQGQGAACRYWTERRCP